MLVRWILFQRKHFISLPATFKKENTDTTSGRTIKLHVLIAVWSEHARFFRKQTYFKLGDLWKSSVELSLLWLQLHVDAPEQSQRWHLETKSGFMLTSYLFCSVNSLPVKVDSYQSICERAARPAEFNWERGHRLAATVKVICPPCAVYCTSRERTGLSTLIMDSVLIVCLWDKGAAEKRISKCSDFHQCSCQTFSLFTLHLPARPFSPERCWGDGRLQFGLFPLSDGRTAWICHCSYTTTKKAT